MSFARKLDLDYQLMLNGIKRGLFNRAAKNKTALFIIDVQAKYCSKDHPKKNGTDQTEEMAKKIPDILRAFRKASVPIYLIRIAESRNEQDKKDFYGFKANKHDKVIIKYTNSAFDIDELGKHLKKRKIKNIIAFGVNRSYCVKETLIDAKDRKYRVFMLDDLSLNGADFNIFDKLRTDIHLAFRGVKFIKSQDILSDVAKISAKKPKAAI